MSRHRYRPRFHVGRFAVYFVAYVVIISAVVLAGLTLYAVFVATPVAPTSSISAPAPRCVDEPVTGPYAPLDGRVWWRCRPT